MSKPKWWNETFEKMNSPLEKFQYLTGLSELSWDDCCDAWFESKKLIPEVANELAQLKAEIVNREGEKQEMREVIDRLKAEVEDRDSSWDRIASELKADLEREREANAKLREALEKIKNGGISDGVLASAATRMLTVCEIAYQALLAAKQDETKRRL